MDATAPTAPPRSTEADDSSRPLTLPMTPTRRGISSGVVGTRRGISSGVVGGRGLASLSSSLPLLLLLLLLLLELLLPLLLLLLRAPDATLGEEAWTSSGGD
jgi:hypothetical protein